LQQGPQMTATEVQVRYELMQRLLGPTLGRFQTEFLNPLIERCFNILDRQGLLAPAPDSVAGSSIDIEYVGPLARSQRMEEATAVERLYEMAAQLAQVAPQIMDNIDHDAAIRSRAELLGVPKNIMRGIDEVQQQRQQQAEQQAQMQQMQQAQMAAQSVGQAAPAVQNAAEAMTDDDVAALQEMMGG